MWLTQQLTPSYKSIANFRKEHPKALKQIFKDFSLLLKSIDLIAGDTVAIDGAFLRANASKNRLIMKKSVAKELEKINEKIDKYLKALTFADEEEKRDRDLKAPTKKFSILKKAKDKLDKDLEILKELNLTQYNKTDPDAKLMVKPSHNLMAYNSQIAVDDKFNFIVTTDIATEGNDTHQLYNMTLKTKEITNRDDTTYLADGGYNSDEEIKKCLNDNIDIALPISKTGQVQGAKGKFKKEDFIYDKDNDCYICPNNKTLTKTKSTRRRLDKVYIYYRISSKICKCCPIKSKCLDKSKSKAITRWEYADIIDKFSAKMKSDKYKTLIKKRGSIVEHPFGTIKRNLGWDHFLVRGKEKVSGENALIMFTYNFKRLINLIGITLFRELIKAIKRGNIEEIKAKIAEYIALFYYICVEYINIFRFYQFRGERYLFES